MGARVVIITGLSGAGKTVALRALEDSGYFSVDNLPPELIERFISLESEGAGVENFAIGIDIRERAFLSSFGEVIPSLREKYHLDVIFLEADPDALIRRFKETRRPHPLGVEGRTIEEAIEKEASLIAPLKALSDRVIDTSSYTPHQLRNLIQSIYKEGKTALSVSLVSFGYKNGIPLGVDLLFDVRFLPNPHFVPELKPLTGLDKPVREFVLKEPQTEEFLKRLVGFLDFLIPLYKKEGKAYLTIGIGCTGGRHRSPAIVECLSEILKEKDQPVEVIHRDI